MIALEVKVEHYCPLIRKQKICMQRIPVSESEDNELEINQSAVLFRAVVKLEGPESSRCPSEGTVSGSGRSVNETRGQ